MGYGLSVFLVPERELARVYGTNDSEFLNEALEALAKGLADYDEQMGAPDLENYDVDLSHADALREIFSGTFTKGANGSRYGWAFETLCGWIGERLDNDGFIPCKMAWYDELDAILAKYQVPLKFQNLIGRSPIEIPLSDDWPCIGHWGAEELKSIGPLSAMIALIDDREARGALSTALGWLQEAAPGPDLIIGFHG
jgi:hypothetical protein